MINNLVQLIEEKIREDLDLDALAEKTGFSKCYVHRLFKALTGQMTVPRMCILPGASASICFWRILRINKKLLVIRNDIQQF